jgi:membrane protein implicated in regulation of membrane protease activity
MLTKNVRHEIEWLPPYEYHRGWSSRGDLVVSLGGLLGVVVLTLIIFLVLIIGISPLIIVLLLRWLILIFIFIILSLILILSWWRCLYGR